MRTAWDPRSRRRASARKHTLDVPGDRLIAARKQISANQAKEEAAEANETARRAAWMVLMELVVM